MIRQPYVWIPLHATDSDIVLFSGSVFLGLVSGADDIDIVLIVGPKDQFLALDAFLWVRGGGCVGKLPGRLTSLSGRELSEKV